MKALLISYNLKKASINQKTILHQTINGYKDHSNAGRYQYHRKGLLSTIPSIKVNRGVFIIKLSDKNKIMPILVKNKASVRTWIIEFPQNRFTKP